MLKVTASTRTLAHESPVPGARGTPNRSPAPWPRAIVAKGIMTVSNQSTSIAAASDLNVIVVGAVSRGHALQAVVRASAWRLGSPTPVNPITLVAAGVTSPVRDDIKKSLNGMGYGVRAAAGTTALDLVRRRTASDWVAVPVADRTDRIASVQVLRSVATAVCLVGAVDIDAHRGRGGLAIGLWMRVIHPTRGIPARLALPRLTIAADLAMAVAPRLMVLTGRIGNLSVAVATPDLIVAELFGLALRAAQHRDGSTTIGPWQQPLVQRATELHLGVTIPDQIHLLPMWSGPSTLDLEMAFTDLIQSVRDRLGLR